MTRKVFAGTWEIAAENGMNKSIARAPDVCLSPPSPPAGPIPVPYQDTSFSNNLKSGSRTVKIGGKGAALAQKSYYKESILGDEAATRAFGANVVTHQITGKTYFQAWCMDVKFEGKNVCRHLDMTTSNHASGGTTTVPLPTDEMMAMSAQDAIAADKCPCCGAALHDYQKGDDGTPLRPISERDYYEKKIKKKEDEARGVMAAFPRKTNVQRYQQQKLDIAKQARTDLDDLLVWKQISRDRVAAAKASGASAEDAAKAGCPNVTEKDGQGCGTYFDTQDVVYTTNPVMDGTKTLSTPAQLAEANFRGLNVVGDSPRDTAVQIWQAKNLPHIIPPGEEMDHKTPRQAGGCNSAYNTTPRSWYNSDQYCEVIETLQSKLENYK